VLAVGNGRDAGNADFGETFPIKKALTDAGENVE
jgi:hypothetical protein